MYKSASLDNHLYHPCTILFPGQGSLSPHSPASQSCQLPPAAPPSLPSPRDQLGIISSALFYSIKHLTYTWHSIELSSQWSGDGHSWPHSGSPRCPWWCVMSVFPFYRDRYCFISPWPQFAQLQHGSSEVVLTRSVLEGDALTACSTPGYAGSGLAWSFVKLNSWVWPWFCVRFTVKTSTHPPANHTSFLIGRICWPLTWQKREVISPDLLSSRLSLVLVKEGGVTTFRITSCNEKYCILGSCNLILLVK